MTVETSVNEVYIPLLIAKRGKGHFETVAQFHVSSPTHISPVEYLGILQTYGRKTFAFDENRALGEDLLEKGLRGVEFTASFIYPLERVSPSFTPTAYALPCQYKTVSKRPNPVASAKHDVGMIISLPVRIRDIHPLPGMLWFELRNAEGLFFEDMVDIVAKVTGAAIYPVTTEGDKPLLTDTMDQGMSPYQYMSSIREHCTTRSLGDGGEVRLVVSDVFRTFSFGYRTCW